MSSTNIKKRYGITTTECIALHVARAILGMWRSVYGEMNDEDAWARYQKLADDNNWSSHQRPCMLSRVRLLGRSAGTCTSFLEVFQAPWTTRALSSFSFVLGAF